MRRAARERKPQPDKAKSRPAATGTKKGFNPMPDCKPDAVLEAKNSQGVVSGASKTGSVAQFVGKRGMKMAA
jgi:hypothetical protein